MNSDLVRIAFQEADSVCGHGAHSPRAMYEKFYTRIQCGEREKGEPKKDLSLLLTRYMNLFSNHVLRPSTTFLHNEHDIFFGCTTDAMVTHNRMEGIIQFEEDNDRVGAPQLSTIIHAQYQLWITGRSFVDVLTYVRTGARVKLDQVFRIFPSPEFMRWMELPLFHFAERLADTLATETLPFVPPNDLFYKALSQPPIAAVVTQNRIEEWINGTA